MKNGSCAECNVSHDVGAERGCLTHISYMRRGEDRVQHLPLLSMRVARRSEESFPKDEATTTVRWIVSDDQVLENGLRTSGIHPSPQRCSGP